MHSENSTIEFPVEVTWFGNYSNDILATFHLQMHREVHLDYYFVITHVRDSCAHYICMLTV